MRRIAFFVQWMLCGGVENALLALANKLIENGNDVTIYVITEKGEFIKKIPPKVKFKKIPMPEKLRNAIPVGGTKVTVRECIEKKEYFRAAKFLVKHKMKKCPFAELNVNLEKIPQLAEKYDIAVNFHMHSPFLVWYISERVAAEKKYAWIHNDFETTCYNIKGLEKYLFAIDHFFAVSDQVREEFSKIFLNFASITSTAVNVIPFEDILEKADEYYPPEYVGSKLKLLTVGRLEEQKGLNIAINVCDKMKKMNLKFDWFILGDGTLREVLQNEVIKKGLEDCFHLLGARMNPYPYFKNCDIYVQTSIHEGYGIALAEARIFNKPIVTTNFAGAKEQIVDKITGRVVEINQQAILEALKEVVCNDKIRRDYSDNLRQTPFTQNLEYVQKYFLNNSAD